MQMDEGVVEGLDPRVLKWYVKKDSVAGREK